MEVGEGMIMLGLTEKASDVRQHFSEFIDTVVRDRPGFLTRNRDILATLNLEHLEVLLESVRFHADIQPDGQGNYVGTLREIEDIVATGGTEQDVITDLARNLTEYAEEYLTDSFRLYFYAPNRRMHFPYVLKIAMQTDQERVANLIHA